MSIKAALLSQLPIKFGLLKAIILTGLGLTYPYLVYKGIENGMSWLAPVIFSGMYLYRAWILSAFRARLFSVLFAITLLLGAYYVQTLTAKIVPVLIQLMLMVFFGRTLLKSNEPSLIERIVRLQYPESPPAVDRYCRQLTQIWTLFFAGNIIVCTALAIWGSTFWWALYNGVIIYMLIGVLAVGEYIYRRIRFADLSILHEGIPDMKATMKAMMINGRKVYLELMEH